MHSLTRAGRTPPNKRLQLTSQGAGPTHRGTLWGVIHAAQRYPGAGLAAEPHVR